MTNKGGAKHLKTLPAPVDWPIHRKEVKWVVKPSAGPHPIRRCFPLLLIVRELLGLAKNRSEAKTMISSGHVKVDGKEKLKDDYPVGSMDVVEISAINKIFRVLPSNKGLVLHPIEKGEKDYKLCKIVGKKTVENGQVQLNLHDGKNVLLKIGDPRQPKEDVYHIHDVLKMRIPENEILAHLKFEDGILGLVDRGKNMGIFVEVTKIVQRVWPSQPSLALTDGKGNQFETIVDYVFPIGKGEPWVTLPQDDSA